MDRQEATAGVQDHGSELESWNVPLRGWEGTASCKLQRSFSGWKPPLHYWRSPRFLEIWVENRGGNKEVFCEVSDGKSRCPSACVIDPAL